MGCAHRLDNVAAGSSADCKVCGEVLHASDGYFNLIGNRAHLLSRTRDGDIARRLVAQYSSTADSGAKIPIADAKAARQRLSAAGVSESEIQLLDEHTRIVQVCNDLRSYFSPPEELRPSAAGTFVQSALTPAPTQRVIDIGCSTGRLLASLQARRAELYGLDVDGFALSVCSAAWRDSTAPVLVAGDATVLPFASAHFDYAVSQVVLSVVPIRKVLSEIRRVLKPGGKLVLTIEGHGFLHEQWHAEGATWASRVSLSRWWLGSKLMELGVDWQSSPLGRRLAGFTPYSSTQISTLLQRAGFTVDLLEVFSHTGGKERLTGVVASKSE